MWQKAIALLGLCVAWVLSSAATLTRYVPGHAAVLLVAGVILVAATFSTVFVLTQRGRDVPRWSVYLPAVLLMAGYLAIYPHTQHLGPGRGSDREDALRVELSAVKAGVYPYSVRTYLGDPPTPLPGAMLLALPFYLLGRVSLQNLLWIVLFTGAARRVLRRNCTAVALLTVFPVFGLEGLNDFVAGGDYVVNAFYVAFAIFLAERSLPFPTRRQPFAAFAFLGVCMASRVCYLPVILPVFALVRQRFGLRRAAALCSVALLALAAVTLPVFLPHPVEKLVAYSHQMPGKFHDLPPWLPPSIIEAASVLMAATSLFLPMTLRRVYLVMAASIAVLITPPMFSLVFAQTRRGLPLNHQMVYFTAPAILFALWAAGWLEAQALRRKAAPSLGSG